MVCRGACWGDSAIQDGAILYVVENRARTPTKSGI